MFSRIHIPEWQANLPIAAFVIIFTLFAIFVFRAVRMARGKADRMAALPLEPEQPHPTHERKGLHSPDKS
jgi:hypothetical protein